MKLARKLLVPIVLLLVVVLGASAALAARAEAALFKSDLHNDHMTIVRLVSAAAAAVHGEPELTNDVIRAAARVEEEPIEGERIRLELAAMPEGVTAYDTVEHAGRFNTYGPIAGSPLSVRVSESSKALDASVARTWRRWLITAVLLSAGAVALVLVLSGMLVGRPVSRLSAFAARIGGGDLRRLQAWDGDDELNALGREMSRMCVLLEEAQARAQAEADQRLRAVHALRHADRLGTVGQLAAGVAHELGTPLNVVQGRAQLILDDPKAIEDNHENAGIVVDQVQRMTTIIRQLLDFARATQGESRSCDPRAVSEKTVDLLSAMAKKEGVTLAVSTSDAAAQARAAIDQGLLGQVLVNLVVNAIHATGDRGGEVSIEVDQSSVVPPAPVGGDATSAVSVRVRDRGTGIAKEHLDHIFEPFFTTKDVGKGTGLGLSVSYGIVRDAGGWIDVESEPGKGASFTVWLPIAPPGNGAPSAPAA